MVMERAPQQRIAQVSSTANSSPETTSPRSEFRAYAGRIFADNDDAPAAAPTVVLSYQAWQSEYSGDPSIVGSTIYIQARPFTVIGIAPPGFFGDRVTDHSARFLDAHPDRALCPRRQLHSPSCRVTLALSHRQSPPRNQHRRAADQALRRAAPVALLPARR